MSFIFPKLRCVELEIRMAFLYLQGGSCGREKAFVDIKVESSIYQVGCRAATVTAHRPAKDAINTQQNLFHDHMRHPVPYALPHLPPVLLYFTP